MFFFLAFLSFAQSLIYMCERICINEKTIFGSVSFVSFLFFLMMFSFFFARFFYRFSFRCDPFSFICLFFVCVLVLSLIPSWFCICLCVFLLQSKCFVALGGYLSDWKTICTNFRIPMKNFWERGREQNKKFNGKKSVDCIQISQLKYVHRFK